MNKKIKEWLCMKSKVSVLQNVSYSYSFSYLYILFVFYYGK